jgi:hypothetical protein
MPVTKPRQADIAINLRPCQRHVVPTATSRMGVDLRVIPDAFSRMAANNEGRDEQDQEVDVQTGANGGAARRPVGAVARWFVHLALIVTAAISLVFETVLTIHILVGLVFVALAAAHLLQRRRISATLAGRLLRVRAWRSPAGRLALADALLTVLTIGMLASGLWDWRIGHPTRIRWHAMSGVVLAGYLLVHSLRRRARLRASGIR